MDFFNAPEIIENDDDEVDMFAELGIVNNPVNSNTTKPSVARSIAGNDPLSPFMEEEVVETVSNDNFVFISDEKPGEEIKSTLMPIISEETIAELLEVLVKKELKKRQESGEEWLSDLPAQARADIESARVIRERDAYHLSLIVDMVGSGPVRPFATVQSTKDGFKNSSAPSSIPAAWIPLYNVIRDLLIQAMNALSSTRVGVNLNA